jgi:hypothetical protein
MISFLTAKPATQSAFPPPRRRPALNDNPDVFVANPFGLGILNAAPAVGEGALDLSPAWRTAHRAAGTARPKAS